MIVESWGFACRSFQIDVYDKGDEEFHDLEIDYVRLCMDTGTRESSKS